MTMTMMSRARHLLPGLRPEPLASYLAIEHPPLRSFSRLRRARNSFEYPSTETPGHRKTT